MFTNCQKYYILRALFEPVAQLDRALVFGRKDLSKLHFVKSSL